MSATSVAEIIVEVAELYAAIGVAVAVGFLALGIMRVPPTPARVTFAGRVLLFPASVALWPFVLRRWISPPRRL